MAMHGKHIESQTPMGLKADSGEGDVQSYKVTSEVQGGAGYTCEGE